MPINHSQWDRSRSPKMLSITLVIATMKNLSVFVPCGLVYMYIYVHGKYVYSTLALGEIVKKETALIKEKEADMYMCIYMYVCIYMYMCIYM